MADYLTILRRSIAALPDASPAMRQAVYERARAALARQLTGMDPPLTSEEIEAQHQHLEDAIGEVEAELAASEAAAAPEPQEGWEPPDAPTAPDDEPAGEPEPYEAPYEAAEEAPQPEEPLVEPRRSRAPLAVMALLLLLIAGGAAALAYTQWGTVETAFQQVRSQMVGMVGSEPADPPPQAVAEAPRPEPEPELRADDPAAGAPEPKIDARVPPDTEPDEAPADVIDERPGERLAATPFAPLGEVAPRSPAEAAVGATPLVAQRAIFYEEGEEGTTGGAAEGAVAWTRLDQPQDLPAIRASIDLPGHDVAVQIVFARNTDPALPASHLIEIEIEGAESLTSGVIERIPALVVKPTEQARGQALTGAAVPVTESLFWIALSDDADQQTRNLSLLRDGSWFDVPVLFDSGRRALLTFEKGIPGDRLFEAVLAEWEQAQP